MALETASYVTQLVASNPPEGDPVEQAADHLRLIKLVLLNTLPNLNAACPATPKNLTYDFCPVGGIIMWSGSIVSIPSGWALCNGQTVALLDGSGNVTTPNLQDVFIIGAGDTYAPGAVGGAASNTPAISINAVTLTQANLPSYNLTVTDPGHTHSYSDPGHAHNLGFTLGSGVDVSSYGAAAISGSRNTIAAAVGITINSTTTGISVNSGGSGTTFTPTGSCAAVPTLPPYYALAFIMKL